MRARVHEFEKENTHLVIKLQSQSAAHSAVALEYKADYCRPPDEVTGGNYFVENQLAEVKEKARVELERSKQEVFDVTAECDWLVESGIPATVEAIRDSDCFLDHVAAIVGIAKDLGHHEGMLVGSVVNSDVKVHACFDPLSEERLAKANVAFDDAKFSVMEILAEFGNKMDLEGLRKFLNRPMGVLGKDQVQLGDTCDLPFFCFDGLHVI
ncbi:hypothetical protein L1987_20851 [Smallanthus sonchifolius]|uniref:Uncharacterized protein n=1 Tax=Smallanthus sonchifolius TaxID=185202 RepID=A0ACB9IS73_9ASTR|nr:hypothetical protein L1987_20851 [Smallanthus sonchifolius]